MSFFSEEDNKKLYESNLIEPVKKIISAFNEIIILYIKDKFKGQENLEELLLKIKEEYKKVEYIIDYNSSSSATASFKCDGLTGIKSFIIKARTLELFSIETEFLSIYAHEFSHFLAFLMKKIRPIRIDEGVADLFSDEVVDFYNKYIANEHLLEKKISAYSEPASIVRSACLLNNDTTDLFWNYYNDNDSEIKGFFIKAFGKEGADYIFNIESVTNNRLYLSKKEKDIITSKLQNIDISSIDKNYIRLNSTLQETICKRLEEENTSIEELSKYTNLPKDFFDNYKIVFESINKERNEILNDNELDEEKLKIYEDKAIAYIKFKDKKNPNKKIGHYNDYVLDTLLEFLNYNEIYYFILFYSLPYLYAYKTRYNDSNFNEIELNSILDLLGYSNYLEKDVYTIISNITQSIQNKFNKLEKDECFKELENVIKNQIGNSVKIDFYEKKLEAKKISVQDFVREMLKIYNEENETLYKPLNCIDIIIEKYVQDKKENLTLETFEKTRDELVHILDGIDQNYFKNITALIITNWNIDNVKIYDVLEIIEKYKLDTTVSNHIFEDIRIKGILDIEEEKDMKNILRYIKSITSSNYYESTSFSKYLKANIIDENDSIKIQKEKVKQILLKEKDLLKKLVAEDNKNIQYFYIHNNLNPLSEDDKKKMQEITGKDINSNRFNDYIRISFDEDLYLKLKKYPHLAATYIANFIPSKRPMNPDILSINIDIGYSRYYNNDFLKKEYEEVAKKQIERLNPEKYRIIDSRLKYEYIYEEMKALELAPYNFLNEEEEKEYIEKIFIIIHKKLDIIFNRIETEKTLSEIKELLINRLKYTQEKTTIDIIKQKLDEVIQEVDSIDVKSK